MALQKHEQDLWDSAMVSLAADSDHVDNYLRAEDESVDNENVAETLVGHREALNQKLGHCYGLSDDQVSDVLKEYQRRYESVQDDGEQP